MDPMTERPAMTSVEKINVLVNAFTTTPPEDEETAQRQALLNMILATGQLDRFVPSDPAELDHLLLRGARFALELVSDLAPRPATLEDLLAYGDASEQEAAREA